MGARSAGPRFALVDGGDSWSRAAHLDTFLQLEEGVVALAWRAPYDDGDPPEAPALVPAGLAFDAECRLYRSVPDAGRVERVLWRAGSPYASPDPTELFAAEAAPSVGDFDAAAPAGGPLAEPRGLAVDVDDRLVVAEAGAGRILVHDLWSRRLLRAVPTPPGTQSML